MPITVKRVTQREHGVEYKTWMVAGYVNGKRIRIRCQSQQEALMRKSEKETEAINSERSSRFIQTRLTATQLNEAEFCFDRLAPRYGLTEAVDYFLKNFHAPDFAITVGEASVKFRGAMEGVIRDRTLVQLKSTIGQFERFTDNANLHEITTERVERFLQSLRAKDGVSKASRRTWNNYRGDLHQFFQWCSEKPQKYIIANPAAEIKRFELAQGAVDVLTVEQCQELMDYAVDYKGGKYVRYFALALFAGIRPAGELGKLADQPELIDLENKVIRITAAVSKVGRPRQVRIRPNLLRWLQRFPGPILAGANHELKIIRKALGLTHDILRHTFCSAHVMAFGSFADAAIESGNSETIIRTHYLNAIPKSEAKLFWTISPK
jgi:integrase family protein with SAM-like domain